ncbi:rhamnan synthesis F family protein [Lactococcus taiwanensis]|uniref:rhamnan synthesis F family protein n=1 Tax=Lactococcus taiwanensis TaxID=1151742 RepID=UPI003D0C4415
MKKLLLYLITNSQEELAEHLNYQIGQLSSTFDQLIFVTKNTDNDLDDWAKALQDVGFDQLKNYDVVTLMNDSTFGPITEFQAIFDKMHARENDFWGLTNLCAENSVAEIQPYFMTFKDKIISSQVFQDFWTKSSETALTAYFEQAGFKSDVLFDTQNADTKEMLGADFANYNLSAMLEHGVPFLKIEAFAIAALNSTLPAIMEYIKQISVYPTALITDYMTWLDYPDRPYMLNDKLIQISQCPRATTSQTVAIHLHVFYKDLLCHFVGLFDKFVQKYDLYITTDTEESKVEIEKLLVENSHLKEIIVVGKKGRDVLPWMKIHEKLSDYDIAGHFHTKKSAENLWIVGESWRTDIEKQLIEPAQQLFEVFENNPKLGLIIPEVPAYYQSNFGPLPMDEAKMWEHMAQMWIDTDFEIEKGLRRQDFYLMSYGTMVWYRPSALNNLLSIDIESKIPAEPLPKNSILHAFERLLVYVAWGNNFDFRIAHRNNYNGFWANNAPGLAMRQLLSESEESAEFWEFMLSETKDEKVWEVLLKDDSQVWEHLKDSRYEAWRFLRLRDIMRLGWEKMKFIIKKKLGRH